MRVIGLFGRSERNRQIHGGTNFAQVITTIGQLSPDLPSQRPQYWPPMRQDSANAQPAIDPAATCMPPAAQALTAKPKEAAHKAKSAAALPN